MLWEFLVEVSRADVIVVGCSTLFLLLWWL